jgi:hypothetical protein
MNLENVINIGEFGDEDEIRWRKDNYLDIFSQLFRNFRKHHYSLKSL